MNIGTVGESIGAAGGGLLGAVAVLLVLLGVGVAFFVWKAYQSSVETNQKELIKLREEDREEKAELRRELQAVRDESRVREGRLIELTASQQQLQRETNKILEKWDSRLARIERKIRAEIDCAGEGTD